MVLSALDLLRTSERDVWLMPEGIYTVIFADGTVSVNKRNIVFSHFYWRLFREFPGAEIKMCHLFQGTFTKKVPSRLGAKVFMDAFTYATNKYENMIWDMSKVFYQINNTIYNFTCTKITEYVTTASLYDFHEVLTHPKIKMAKEEYLAYRASPNQTEKGLEAAIKKVHSVTEQLLYVNDNDIPHNGIKKMCIAEAVRKGQMMQLIGPRGLVHDIDGRVFKHPIDVGYAEGLHNLYDSAIESRSASRALFMTESPLRNSEYFNREMQLLCSVIHSVVNESCNNYVTVPWLVTEDDEQLLRGKYYMENGVAKLIWTDNFNELVGKWIEYRSLTGCGNEDTQTICKTCLGWSSVIMQPGTNVGYSLVTILCAIISQLMLSTKHFEGSAGSQKLDINEKMFKWIRKSKVDEERIMLQKVMCKKNPIIRIDLEYVKQLNNILSVDVNEIHPSKISNIKEFYIVEGDANGYQLGPFDEIKTVISGQGIHLSTDVLKYIKTHGWASNTKYIEFQLKNWDSELPIFITPRLGDNIYLFLQEVKSFVMPSKTTEINITNYTSRGAAIGAFVDLLSKRLSFNITQVEIFVKACMVRDKLNRDFNLPHPREEFSFMHAKQCLYNRSLTTLLAYEIQAAAIIDPEWYMNNSRVTHMLDQVLQS